MFFITNLNLQSFSEVHHLFTFPHMAVMGHLSNSEGHQEDWGSSKLNGVNFGEFTMESSPHRANEEALSQPYFRIDKTLRCWLVFTNLLSDQDRRQSIVVLIFMMRNMIVEWDGTCPVSPVLAPFHLMDTGYIGEAKWSERLGEHQTRTGP